MKHRPKTNNRTVASHLLVLLTLWVSLTGCSSGNDLVKDGKSDYKIFVSATATATEKNAALELQKYIGQISGCKLELTNQKTEDAHQIFIGFKEAPQSLLKDLDTAAFGKEEFVIRSDGKSMLIGGGQSRGTMYGVITYLSDHLGCRWYTREVTKISSLPTIKLSKMDERQKPAMEYRMTWYREAFDTQWALHNRSNKSIGARFAWWCFYRISVCAYF